MDYLKSIIHVRIIETNPKCKNKATNIEHFSAGSVNFTKIYYRCVPSNLIVSHAKKIECLSRKYT